MVRISEEHRSTLLVMAALAALALPGSAGATVLYDNLSNPNSLSSTSVSSTTWAANSFSTDNNTYHLSDVILSLEGISTTGTLTVSLYSSNNGIPPSPTSSLTTLGTISDSSLSTSSFTQQTVPGGGFTLSPNTMYFVVLSGSSVGAFDAAWERENGATGTGVAGQAWGISTNAGSSWLMHTVSTDFQPYLMRVDATTTPEPGTVTGALAGMALLALGSWRRKQAHPQD
jgi:MYXO-CTERM domain-containing protein